MASMDVGADGSPGPGIMAIEGISHAQIHRLLLEGAVAPVRETPSFRDYDESLTLRKPYSFYGNNPLVTVGANSGLIVTCIVQAAYRDSLCAAMEQHRSLDAPKSLLISLHDKIRSLIPNRVDLHDQLSDHIRERKRKGLLLRIISAAQALEQLESDARAETTNAWIDLAQKQIDEGLDSSMTDFSEDSRALEISDSFLITSILYLLFKAELCQQDKEDFSLDQHSKYILEHGVELEREHFIKTFGDLTPEAAPNTLKWIQSIVDAASPATKAALKQSADARHDLVFNGWINDLLFADGQVALPEVLSLDLNGLRGIRDVTRIAAAGSALALHACNAAGKQVSVLEQPDDDAVYRCRASMVLAMSERHGKNSAEYEAVVAGHVISLAKLWNPNLDEQATTILRNQCVKVLRGEDAVIQVLEGRVKVAFAEIVCSEGDKHQPLPASMKTGTGGSLDVSFHTSESRSSVKAVFNKKGFTFYSSDLALAASKAFKIIDLSWRAYSSPLLEPMILCMLD